MKKILFSLVIATAVLFTSCSKEYTLNSQLNGTWEVTTYEGEAPEAGESLTFTFDKTSSSEGTVVIAQSGGGISLSLPGTYVLDGDTKMTITILGSAEVLTVNSHSKSALKLTNSDGEVTELKKQ